MIPHFIAGFVTGCVFAIVFFCIWVLVYRYLDGVEKGEMQLPTTSSFSNRRERKKPRFVSEEEQWRKEQPIAPRDPGQ